MLASVFSDDVFTFLLNSSGAVALFVYLLIAISELVMRRRLEREAPERLQVRMWLYPWLTIFSGLCIVAVLVSMIFIDASTRVQFFATVGSIVVILVAYLLRRRFGPRELPAEQAAIEE